MNTALPHPLAQARLSSLRIARSTLRRCPVMCESGIDDRDDRAGGAAVFTGGAGGALAGAVLPAALLPREPCGRLGGGPPKPHRGGGAQGVSPGGARRRGSVFALSPGGSLGAWSRRRRRGSRVALC